MSVPQFTVRPPGVPTTGSVTPFPRLWIDLDNSPHVPLFAPLIRRLKATNCEVLVTARDFAQTLDLVDQLGIEAIAVGKHAGKNKIRKVLNLPVRAWQLIRAVRSFKPELAFSHGSRTQALAAWMLSIPSLVMFDYEWSDMRVYKAFATRMLCPSAITPDLLKEAGIPLEKISWYDGYKEDLYLPEFRPDAEFRAALGVEESQRLITVRPPGIIGNYHDERSEEICRELLRITTQDSDNVVVILPKTSVEREFIRSVLPPDPKARVIVPEQALPGLQLIYSSDYVISGGGTMNREAARLGVPVYSMFTGKRPAIDAALARQGLLQFLEEPSDVADIKWRKRRIDYNVDPRPATLIDKVMTILQDVALPIPYS